MYKFDKKFNFFLNSLVAKYRSSDMSESAAYTFNNWDKQQIFFRLQMSIDTKDGKTKDHLILSQFNGATEWDCYNELFNNHFTSFIILFL